MRVKKVTDGQRTGRWLRRMFAGIKNLPFQYRIPKGEILNRLARRPSLFHFSDDALNLALLVAADGSRPLQNVGLMRDATDKLSMIVGVIKTDINDVLDKIGQSATYCIGRGIWNPSINAIDSHRWRKIAGWALSIGSVRHPITVAINNHLRLRPTGG